MDKSLSCCCSWQKGFSSYPDAFLDHEASYMHCCTISCTHCVHTCRRSPRLLTNGYYVLTEDSFLCDGDGNVTLSPSQTSVTYKETLVRIFRKRKKIRRSLVNLFSNGISSSHSWLNSTAVDPSHEEDTWVEDSQMDADYCENGNVDLALESHSLRTERLKPMLNKPSFATDEVCTELREHQYISLHPFPVVGEKYFHEKSSDCSESFTVRKGCLIMLIVCLIVSLCIRFFWGELLNHMVICFLLIFILTCSLVFLH